MKHSPLSSPRILFLVAALVGFAVAFGGPGLLGKAEAGQGLRAGSVHKDGGAGTGPEAGARPAGAATPESLAGIDEMDAYRIATQLVEQRDAALRAGDGQALAALTVEGSGARRADGALLASLDTGIERLETIVMDVRPVSELVWDVTTVQYDYARAGGASQPKPLAERCTRWTLAPDPWRLADTAVCES